VKLTLWFEILAYFVSGGLRCCFQIPHEVGSSTFLWTSAIICENNNESVIPKTEFCDKCRVGWPCTSRSAWEDKLRDKLPDGSIKPTRTCCDVTVVAVTEMFHISLLVADTCMVYSLQSSDPTLNHVTSQRMRNCVQTSLPFMIQISITFLPDLISDRTSSSWMQSTAFQYVFINCPNIAKFVLLRTRIFYDVTLLPKLCSVPEALNVLFEYYSPIYV